MISIHALQHRSIRISELEIDEGYTAIIGSNGSGKTSLLRLCAGIELPDVGEVSVNGRSPRDCEIGWVGEFPDRSLVFERVLDEIASPLRFRRVHCDETMRRVKEIAGLLNIDHLLDRRIPELSGGEKVMVALATAVVGAPQILILDEFDSHVDMETQEALFHVLDGLKIPHILHATHQMEIAGEADMIVYMEEGDARHAGPPDEVFRALEGTCYHPIVEER